MGIVNYAVMALIQLEIGVAEKSEEVSLAPEKTRELYDKYIHAAKDLMMSKNHDYGEAWRQMRISLSSLARMPSLMVFRWKSI